MFNQEWIWENILQLGQETAPSNLAYIDIAVLLAFGSVEQPFNEIDLALIGEMSSLDSAVLNAMIARPSIGADADERESIQRLREQAGPNLEDYEALIKRMRDCNRIGTSKESVSKYLTESRVAGNFSLPIMDQYFDSLVESSFIESAGVTTRGAEEYCRAHGIPLPFIMHKHVVPDMILHHKALISDALAPEILYRFTEANHAFVKSL